MPKNYRESSSTNKHLKELLPGVLKAIGDVHKDRPDQILATWPKVIGEKYAPMAQAVSFEEGVLVVKVKNSTLHSLLCQHEKERLLRELKKEFPLVPIRNIIFRL